MEQEARAKKAEEAKDKEQDKPEKVDKPDQKPERDERNGSIFAWLLARIRVEKTPPENVQNEVDSFEDESTEEDTERVIVEAEEAIAEAEEVVEIRHEHEAELATEEVSEPALEPVDYEVEWAHAETVRGDSREVIDQVAVTTDSYFDTDGPDYSVDSSPSPIPAAASREAVRSVEFKPKRETLSSYFYERKQKQVEKKLKKEVARHKKKLKKLEEKVSKVQEDKIKNLVGRITDLENDNHQNHFEPRHVYHQEKVIVERVVETRRNAPTNKVGSSTYITERSADTSDTKNRAESVQTANAREVRKEVVKVQEQKQTVSHEHKEYDQVRDESSEKVEVQKTIRSEANAEAKQGKSDAGQQNQGAGSRVYLAMAQKLGLQGKTQEPEDREPANERESISRPRPAKVTEPVYWVVVVLMGVLVAAALLS